MSVNQTRWKKVGKQPIPIGILKGLTAHGIITPTVPRHPADASRNQSIVGTTRPHARIVDQTIVPVAVSGRALAALARVRKIPSAGAGKIGPRGHVAARAGVGQVRTGDEMNGVLNENGCLLRVLIYSYQDTDTIAEAIRTTGTRTVGIAWIDSISALGIRNIGNRAIALMNNVRTVLVVDFFHPEKK